MKGSNWVRFQDGLQGAVFGYVPSRVADNDGSKFLMLKKYCTIYIFKNVL